MPIAGNRLFISYATKFAQRMWGITLAHILRSSKIKVTTAVICNLGDISMNQAREKATLSVCAIMKNEGPYLVEWLEFHKLVGVERFYLYNNNSTDNTVNILDVYTDRGEVILHDWPLEINQQLKAYTHCLKNYKTESEWIAFIDLDEFLFPTEKDNLQEILEEFVGYSGIGVNWLMFGTSNHEKKTKGLQIENYTKRAKNNYAPNKAIKSIVNSSKTIRPLNPHHFLHSKGRLVTENKERIIGHRKTKSHSVKKIRINHYFTRSKEESREKMMRGRADNNKKRSWSQFESADYTMNKVKDLTIQRFLPQLRVSILDYYKTKLHHYNKLLEKYTTQQ